MWPVAISTVATCLLLICCLPIMVIPVSILLEVIDFCHCCWEYVKLTCTVSAEVFLYYSGSNLMLLAHIVAIANKLHNL